MSDATDTFTQFCQAAGKLVAEALNAWHDDDPDAALHGAQLLNDGLARMRITAYLLPNEIKIELVQAAGNEGVEIAMIREPMQ